MSDPHSLSFPRPKSGLLALAGASAILVAGRISGAATALLFTIVLARTMPPQEVGAVLTAVSTAFLCSILVTVYIESGSIRFLVAAKEAGRPDVLNGFIFVGRSILVCAAPLIVGAFITAYLLSGGAVSDDRTLMVIAAAISIPIMGWLRLSGSHGTALGQVLRGSLPRTALQPLLQLLIFVAYALNFQETPGGAMLCILSSYALTAIVQFVLLRPTFAREGGGARTTSDWRNWVANGAFLAPLPLMQEYFQHAIILAASFVLESPNVAILGVALRFIAFIRFGILAVNMAMSPSLSRAIARGDVAERDRQLRLSALLKTVPATLAAMLVIALAGRILSFFGETYTSGALALAWLTLIPLGAAFFGPSQMLLNISGERLRIFLCCIAGVVVLLAAVPLGGLDAGVSGAAAAAALTSLFWEFLMYLSVRQTMGVDASVPGALFSKR